MGKNSACNKKEFLNPLKITHRSSLVSENEKHCSVNLYDKKVLGRVLTYLRKKKSKRQKSISKENCPVEDSTEGRIDSQIKLRCRQLTNVVQELRKSIMRQNWSEAATLLMILCHPGLKYYSSIIMRTCFILLYNHPDSNLELLQNFIRKVTDYILEEDVNKFIRITFALKKKGLEPVTNGAHVRSTGDYKVTRDPEFDSL